MAGDHFLLRRGAPVGVGVDVLRGFALVLVFSAALSVFIALYNALEERRYDLAIMRTLGASPSRLMALLLGEGMLLAGWIHYLAFDLMIGAWATRTARACTETRKASRRAALDASSLTVVTKKDRKSVV